MNSFKLFELKRKLGVFCLVKGFFELHSKSYGRKKRQKMGEKQQFFSQFKKFKRVQYMVVFFLGLRRHFIVFNGIDKGFGIF